MKPNYLGVVSLLILASVPLTAQVARQETVVPLKNWATPLYWQPNQTERQGSGGAQPQVQFSANQVSTDALTFIAITPCRLIDTRGVAANFNGISPFSGPSIAATTTATFPVQSATEASTDTTPAPCGTIPSIAQAYSLNLTVVPVAGGAVDYISMWPSGFAQPFVATLNDPQGAIVANAAIVPAGTVSGGINVYNQGPANANVIIDMNGFFAAATDGLSNTAIGDFTLLSTTGGGNTAIGESALQNNTNGIGNTASGQKAMQDNTSGDQNTASGADALFNNTTGGNNTALGTASLLNNSNGSNNTAVGYLAGPNSGSLSNTTAIGANAVVSESNALILGSTGANAVSVGIGTAAPFSDYALDVEAVPSGSINGGVVSDATGGNIYLGMTNGTHKFRVDTNGVTYADGGFVSSGADFAESVSARGAKGRYGPGDLLVIEKGSRRSVALSRSPYSTLVAGIYSTKPGILATPHSINDKLDGEVPLAVVGIVPCKVTAENGAIREGDLLVTSSRPGYAMKGTDRKRLVGAVVGKALEPLPKGTGVIEVLVTLQ